MDKHHSSKYNKQSYLRPARMAITPCTGKATTADGYASITSEMFLNKVSKNLDLRNTISIIIKTEHSVRALNHACLCRN